MDVDSSIVDNSIKKENGSATVVEDTNGEKEKGTEEEAPKQLSKRQMKKVYFLDPIKKYFKFFHLHSKLFSPAAIPPPPVLLTCHHWVILSGWGWCKHTCMKSELIVYSHYPTRTTVICITHTPPEITKNVTSSV